PVRPSSSSSNGSVDASMIVRGDSLPNGKISVQQGMFHAISWDTRKPLTVTIVWNPKVQQRQPASLRIAIPLRNYCATRMLSFNGSCYSISELKASLIGSVSKLGGTAQLASFNSVKEVEELFAANNAKLKIFPYRRPLDFDKPVRIEWFQSVAARQTIEPLALRSDDACLAKSITRKNASSATIDSNT
uniref:SHR-BD domain-containing protein n=1 Tax=Macrostomum lignano TaxID=282301 RepID=A0A1I8GWB9_9PLAT